MKTITLLFISIFLLFFSGFSQSWNTYSPIEGNPNLNGFTVFSVDGKGYIIGGSHGVYSNASLYNDTTYRYDPITESWDTARQFPGENRVYANAIDYKDKVYYGFGYAGTGMGAFNDLWEYESSTDTWTELTTCPCEGRAEIAIVALNDTIYVGFGDNFTTTQYSDWWAYDIDNNSWTQKTDFPGQSRHHPQFFALENDIYVGLGHDDNLGDLETFYKYTPTTDTWTQLNDFPVQIEGPGGQFVFQNEGYVAFGLNNNSNNDPGSGQFWKYVQSGDTWTQLESYDGNGYLSPLTFIIENVAYMATESNYWNGAGSTDFNKYEFELIDTVSISKTDRDIELLIYPNPSNGKFFIKTSDLVSVEVTSLKGNVLKTFHTTLIDLKGFEQGVYFLRIITNENVLLKKVLLTK